MSDDFMPSLQEEKMGFSLQTLSYSDSFELEKLGNGPGERLEKAIAIEVDDDNRIKRCRFTNGYIHERREQAGWKTAAVYSTLDELRASQIYIDYRQNLPEAVTEEKEQ